MSACSRSCSFPYLVAEWNISIWLVIFPLGSNLRVLNAISIMVHMCIYKLVTIIISSLQQPNPVTNINRPQPRLHLCHPRMAGWDLYLLLSYHGHTNVGVLNWSQHQLVSAQEHTQHHDTRAAVGGGNSREAGWMTARNHLSHSC